MSSNCAAAIVHAIEIGADAGLQIVVQQAATIPRRYRRPAPMPLCLRAPLSSAKGRPKILTWVAEVAAFWLVSGASAKEKLTVHSPQAVDGRQEVIDIGLDRIVDVAGAGEAELAVGIVVIALEEEGARQFQPHPLGIGLMHQDAAIERDGGVIVLLRHRDGGQQEQGLAVVRLGGQHLLQHPLGVVQPVVGDQKLRGFYLGNDRYGFFFLRLDLAPSLAQARGPARQKATACTSHECSDSALAGCAEKAYGGFALAGRIVQRPARAGFLRIGTE